MIDKFKEFLTGAQYRMDDDQVEGWAYQIAVILPSVLRKWYDPDFGRDVWAKDGGYYEKARLELAGLAAFSQECDEAGETLRGLKYLADFFVKEKCKAGRGKTARKIGVGAGVGVGVGVGAGGGRSTLPVMTEGEIVEVHFAKHERNAALRTACVEHFRTKHEDEVVCEACGISFGKRYGRIGEGYIEVHHLSPISQTEGAHSVDPATDLVPLCANCHAMIHRLMAAEKKATGNELEGQAALAKLRSLIEENT